MKYLLRSALLIGLLLGGCIHASAAADIVFRNGKVYTVNEKQPWAQAVAVEGNKIVYVGDDRGASAQIGPSTETIDLKGRMLMPGMIDARHIHA